MAIEQLVEEVATNFEEAAEVTRQLNSSGLAYFGVGVGVGLVAGIIFGLKYNKEKLRAEAIKEAEEEIAPIREVYLQKMIALENAGKPSVESIVEQHGYSIGVDPLPARALKPPVPILDDLPSNPVGSSKSKNANWSYAEELEKRSPSAPYVIHMDEFQHSQPDYTKVSYTYYAIDDVLVDDDDQHPIPHADLVVGQDNLKFGHGSDDINMVYVRNDRLNTDMEITRVNKSFEVEILGMSDGDDDDNDADTP